MKSARLVASALLAGATCAAIAACADLGAASALKAGRGAGEDEDASDTPLPGVPLDGGARADTANGVLLVHAAAFPAFRLCFENYPDVLPQPDAKVMPQANMVGVEMGGVVRIGAMPRPPGRIYVLSQERVKATLNDPSAVSCGEQLKKLDLNLEYQVAGRIDRPIGVGAAEVLVLSGCGGGGFLGKVGVPSSDCPGWNTETAVDGTLKPQVFPLGSSTISSASKLSVQLLSLSSELDKHRPEGRILDVSFGALDAGPEQPLAQRVASGVQSFDASAPVVLDVAQTAETTFGTHGFRIAYRPADGGATSADAGDLSIDESLAVVQSTSRPDGDPTTYFLSPTSYALLLLGDPRVQRTFADGGVNAGFDARRGVHLLAVPVHDDSDAGPLGGDWDAGPSPAAGTSDAGSR